MHNPKPSNQQIKRRRDFKGPIVDDFLVMVLNDDVVQLVPLDFLAVDFFPGVFPLA